jgi:hypothetical protein
MGVQPAFGMLAGTGKIGHMDQCKVPAQSGKFGPPKHPVGTNILGRRGRRGAATFFLERAGSAIALILQPFLQNTPPWFYPYPLRPPPMKAVRRL